LAKSVNIMMYKTRRTKIQTKTAYRKWSNKQVPWISFAGIYIQEAGFKDGDVCEIKVRRNQLMITKLK
jgi:DNA-directed RNA polymerase subunit H (RpoH/RPB5)